MMIGLVLSFSDSVDVNKKQQIIDKAQKLLAKLKQEDSDLIHLPANAILEIKQRNYAFLVDYQQLEGLRINTDNLDFLFPLTLNFYDALRAINYNSKTASTPPQLTNPDWLSDIAPPFGVFYKLKNKDTVICATDICGLKHIYSYCQHDWAAVSSSALLLGLLTNENLDWDALVTFSQTGFMLGNASLFRNVKKVESGTACLLDSGKIVEKSYHSFRDLTPTYTSYKTAVDDGFQILRGYFENIYQIYNRIGTELSGGFDSRLVLAAIPGMCYNRTTALTLGTPDTKDYQIAQKIATTLALNHKLVNLEALQQLDTDHIIKLGKKALIFKDIFVNSLSHCVLRWVETQFGTGARLSGANGEITRGFYYTGQTDHNSRIERSVDELIKWRIIVNEKVNMEIFNPDLFSQGMQSCRKVIHNAFASYPGSWLHKTDFFYQLQRMQRWVGISASGSSQTRTMLLPFFQREYINWAFNMPPKYKQDGKVLVDIMQRFNKELTRMNLANNYTPLELSQKTLYTKIKKMIAFSTKAAIKIGQKMGIAQKTAVGTLSLARRLNDQWADLCTHDWLNNFPELRGDTIKSLLEKKRINDPPTLSFLLNLQLFSEIKTRINQESIP